MSAARKKELSYARRRCSDILEEINRLMGEFDHLRVAVKLGQPGADAQEVVDGATNDARFLIGDELDDDRWIVGANRPMTREQLDEETRERVESGTRRAAGDGR